MDNENHEYHRRHDVSPLLIGLLGVIAGAIIVATLHCMILGWCSTQERQQESSENERPWRNIRTAGTNRDLVGSSSSMSNSSVQLIPIFKYTKGFNEGSCVICLGEFKENEEIRVLPECAHHFHVPCIDKWLFSHPNCPLCRTDIVPPLIEHVEPDRIDIIVPSRLENVITISENDTNVINTFMEHTVAISSPDEVSVISSAEISVANH